MKEPAYKEIDWPPRNIRASSYPGGYKNAVAVSGTREDNAGRTKKMFRIWIRCPIRQ